MRSWLFTACLIGGLLLPGFSPAAGFNCARARTGVEKMICADPHLSALDSKLTSVYKKALDAADDTQPLRRAQKIWLKTRNTCRDAACLTRAYTERIKVLDEQIKETARAVGRGWELRERWYKRLRWLAGCEQEYRGQFSGSNGPPPGNPGKNGYGVEIYKLEGNARLAVVQCSLAAYQGTFVVLRFDKGVDKPGRLLTFKEYEREKSGKVEESNESEPAGLPTFNPATRTLTFLSLGRGLGDCGALVTYAFEGGRAVVTRARAQYCYDNPKKMITDPKKWPRVQKP